MRKSKLFLPLIFLVMGILICGSVVLVAMTPFAKKIIKFEQGKKALEKITIITISFKDDASSKEIQSLTQEIKRIDGVKEVKYLSKEEAFRLWKEMNKSDPKLFELVSPDSLPASIEVHLNNNYSSLRETINNLAKKKTFVENVSP